MCCLRGAPRRRPTPQWALRLHHKYNRPLNERADDKQTHPGGQQLEKVHVLLVWHSISTCL